MSRPPRDSNALLRCADVLGAFGVTAADVRRETATEDALEDALADVLADGRDRRAVLRRTIARSDRGISCSARYARETLETELRAVFESIGWSFDLERVDARTPAERRQLRLRASDYHDRRRETTFEYPETPLGTDNLPAVLWAINDILLAGADARFVLLSAGVDRWQAALIDEHELDRLRERYGPRLTAVDRSVLPAYVLGAYVPVESTRASKSESTPESARRTPDPWPDWAHERERDETAATTGDVGSLIDEAEDAPLIEEAETTATESAHEDSVESPPNDGVSERDAESTDQSATADGSSGTSAPSAEVDGFELRGGSPSVSRVRDGDGDSDDATESAADDRNESETAPPSRAGRNSVKESTNGSTDTGTTTESDDRAADEFGTLSGTTTTARVSNDSFGSGVEWESEGDRYRALGAALGAGGNVSVRGLLEDDDFLPELPAAEPAETKIAFRDPFDPAALQKAKAAAEQSGFVWVDSGSLETTRVSNG